MPPGFIQSTLARLLEVERHTATPEQSEALQAARTLLHFIQERSESDAFQEFSERFDTAPLTPLLSFVSREEAEAWLRNHSAPPHGAIIGAGNDLYTVVDVRALGHRKLLRLPPPDKAAPLEETGDEQEPGDEATPPPPHPGTSFSLFELYNWTCYHLHALEGRLDSAEQLAAIKTARVAFDFVMRVGEEHGFQDYLECIRLARAAPPLKSFASREEADTWLMTQPEPPPSAVVTIQSEPYAVGYNRRRELRVLTRLPTQREQDSGAS